MSCRQPLRPALLVAAATAALLPAAIHPADAPAATCASATAKPGGVTRRAAARSTLCLLNARRRSHGLRPLRANARLSRAARGHSLDMVRRRYFSHTSPSGQTFVTRIRRTGYLHRAKRWMVGENLAWGTLKAGSPRSIVRAWMRSPHHRANILNPSFREIGIGLVPGTPLRRRHPSATYTTDFGVTR